MNQSETKQNFIKALGLRKLTENEILLRMNAGKQKVIQPSNLQKARKRSLRKPRVVNGVRNHVFHFSPDGKQSKKLKGLRDIEIAPPKTKAVAPVMPSSAACNGTISTTATTTQQSSPSIPPPQLSTPHNLLLLPSQNKGQQPIQAHPSIVLGQTIFQGPDGKKFILIPSSAAKQAGPGAVHVSKGKSYTPVHTPILPLSGNLKIKASTESTSPQQGFLYLPHNQTILTSAAATTASASQVTSVTNVLPASQATVIPAQKPGTKQLVSRQMVTSKGNSQSNIMQLLNMTRTALGETQFPVASVNLGVWPATSNQAVQLMKIKPNDANQKEASSARTASVSRLASIQANTLAPSTLAPTSVNITMTPLALETSNTASQVPLEIPKMERIVNPLSIANNTRATVVVTNSVFTAPLSVDFNTVPAKIPISPSIKMSMNPDIVSLGVMEPRVDAAKYQNQETSAKDKVPSLQAKSHVKVSHIGQYLGDPKKNVLNPETNCLVIQGRKRKKKREFKSFVHYRRYGGPPFVPSKAPPAPNSPSSGTCCLYEHTLLKMATRGFWGCEMGQLQDVFRSIRSESIDLDTVEDVTKRCYGFVRQKLVAAGEDSKVMYRYMKNYIDEFDSFLDRVYPVAVIAMLIYLPTASDYSLVTWHGIPPTGWSEYRRAVVMREVFEVVYRFGTELNTVPEYQKAFFDCPVKSPLLVPRVFDLRQSYSDPTTCVVQKLSQTDKGATCEEMTSSSCHTRTPEVGQIYSEGKTAKGDPQKGDATLEKTPEPVLSQPKVIQRTESSSFRDVDNSVVRNPFEGINPNAWKDEENVTTDFKTSLSKDDSLDEEVDMLVKPRNVSPEDGVCSLNKHGELMEQSECHFHSVETKPQLGRYGQYYNLPGVVKQENERGASPALDRNSNTLIRVKEEPRGVSQNGAELSKGQTGEQRQMVISAGFAESIVAACENRKSWIRDSVTRRNEAGTAAHPSDAAVRSAGPFNALTRGTPISPTLEGPLQVDVSPRALTDPTDALQMVPQDILPVEDANVAEQMVYSDQENSCSNDGTILGRRRTSRRLTNSARFDLMGASDELSLERDLRKAIKLSKLEVAAGSRPVSESEEAPAVNPRVDEEKKADKVPLRNSLKPFCIENFGIKDDAKNCVTQLKKINRSVAFEALWTQMAVEEPTVALEDKTYSLGEFLEKFPVETHCPPDRTVIRACGHVYKARDILGYLRRGTQLVEQVDNEVVVDTTRTVKSNAVILAVRKVPPGKISKLVHPDLHLENYTGFLLPLGVKQPGKGRRGNGRSATRLKRKSSQTKEEGVVKSEPGSPFLCTSPLLENDDSVTSPPPQKLAKLENKDELFIERKDAATEMFVETENKAVQTDPLDQKDNAISMPITTNITDVNSLEKALNSVLETAMAAFAGPAAGSSEASEDPFRFLATSYERAGNFLLNTAKSLSRLKTKELLDHSSKLP